MNEPALHVGMVVPPWIPLPPNAYGGIEAVCASLVDGLVERGHTVSVYGVGQGGTRGRHVACGEPQYQRIGQVVPEVLHAAVSARAIEADAPDIVHDHTAAGLLLARSRPAPTVATMHGPVNGELGEYVRNLGNCLELVAISHNQRGHAPDLPWAGVVHNAVPVQRFPFSAHKEDYALFLGRCSPEKAPHQAILSARAAGIPLVVAAKCVEGPEQEYFARKVRPLLGPDVTWLGEVGGRQKLDLLRWARCLLFPIAWEEPFGMVMIEALACGTPVVALRRGAVPEVIEHGRTGLHTTDPAELPRLLQHVVSMDPADCRAEALARFDVTAMVRGYEAVYRDVLARHRAPMHSMRPVRRTPALEDVG